MRSQRGLTRILWVLVSIAVGVSFVGRPLAMRGGVLAAQAAAQHQTLAEQHAGMAGHGQMPMPCPQHTDQCCAPCLACCPGCVTPPLPTAAPVAGAITALVRLVTSGREPVPAPRSGSRYLQPPPLGPPTPLVS